VISGVCKRIVEQCRDVLYLGHRVGLFGVEDLKTGRRNKKRAKDAFTICGKGKTSDLASRKQGKERGRDKV